MVEEALVGGAEVVEPGLPVRSPDEAVLRALAVAGKAHLAAPAVTRQGVALVTAELPLEVRVDQRAQPPVHDVAELELRIHVVIT